MQLALHFLMLVWEIHTKKVLKFHTVDTRLVLDLVQIHRPLKSLKQIKFAKL